MKQHPLVRLALGLCVALAVLAAHPVLPARAAPGGGNIYLVDRSDDVLSLACTVLPNDCSLRGALIGANANPYSTIVFSGTHNITLHSPLNLTAAGTLIDSQSLQVSIHLSTTPTVAGNVFKISAEDVILRGLFVYGASAGFANIWVTGASTKNILLESIGIGYDNNGACANPNASDGIYIDATGTPGPGEYLVTIDGADIDCTPAGDGIELANASKVLISNSQIARSGGNGVWINLGKDNLVLNNRIGTNAVGVRITGNGANDSSSATGNVLRQNRISCPNNCGPVWSAGNTGGVLIENGAYLNTIGSATPGEENQILKNTAYGIRIVDSNQNYIGGNFIGATENAVDVYSNYHGIELLNASGTFIGPLGTGFPGNLISGNDGDGIVLSAGTRNTTIQGNIIGPNFALTRTLLNFGSGIRIDAGAHSNFIGGNDASFRGLAARPDDNIIGGNNNHGVLIAGATTTSNTVGGNQIGFFDNMGTIVALGNPSDGVRFEGSGAGNRVINAAFAYNVNGIYLNNSGYGTIQDSAVYSSIAHGIVLSGNLTYFNAIVGVVLEGNGRDGLTEKAVLTSNSWLPWRVRGNGGLGIDRNAPDDALDQPSPGLLMTTILDYDRQTGFVTGSGVPSAEIHLYGVIAADRDPSGYGEGTEYLGTINAGSGEGDWSAWLSESLLTRYPCVTALASYASFSFGTGEFSQNVCRPSKVFVPAVAR